MSHWQGAPALDIYGRSLRAVARGGQASVLLRETDGRAWALDLHGWSSVGLDGDAGVLDRCAGPTLDVGCGPGRLAAALHRRGIAVLGIDISAEAVRVAAGRLVPALQVSVFEPLPNEGGWSSILLVDGNLGIGGRPRRLLGRCRRLLAAGGTVLVESHPAMSGQRRTTLRLEDGDGASGWFPWAFVGGDALAGLAADVGLRLQEEWSDHGRAFASLGRA